MQPMKARVQIGRIILYEPSDLPDGIEIPLVHADGEAMRGSLAITSIRKPSGNLNAAALSSGDIGLGASVGLGICARAKLVAQSAAQASAVDFRGEPRC